MRHTRCSGLRSWDKGKCCDLHKAYGKLSHEKINNQIRWLIDKFSSIVGEIDFVGQALNIENIEEIKNHLFNRIEYLSNKIVELVLREGMVLR